jgi:hypothetical protein
VSTSVRWALALLAVLLLVGLAIWARGDEHHRGDEVGSVAVVTDA